MANSQDDRAPLEGVYDLLVGTAEEIERAPRDEIRAFLKTEGIDPDFPARLAAEVRRRLAEHAGREELARAREILVRNRQRLRLLLGGRTTGKAPPPTRAEMIARIERAVARSPERIAVNFRRFEEATDADLASLLDDLEAIDHLGGDDGTARGG